MIRPATIEDAALLHSLERAAFGTSGWSEAQVLGTLEHGGGFGLIAFESESAVAHLLGRAVAGEAELLRIGVRPDHRRRGLGSLLLEAFHGECAERKAPHRFLEVRADNIGAQALYRSHAWSEAGRRPRYYRDGTDALIFTARV